MFRSSVVLFSCVLFEFRLTHWSVSHVHDSEAFMRSFARSRSIAVDSTRGSRVIARFERHLLTHAPRVAWYRTAMASSASASSAFVAPTFIPSSQLHALLVDPITAATTLVVDVRDEDFVGGHVAGAMNVPSEEFRETMHTIHTAAAAKQLVVFHCMKSQMRGPSCARLMAESVAKSGATAFPPIVILEDGFSGWARYVSRLEEPLKSQVKCQLITAYSKEHHGYNI
jgi:rhodanese-related sulfurtransferase